MKTKQLLATGILMLLPTVMSAQTHVKPAFEKFIKNRNVDISAKHSLSKDPETGKKDSQLDIYTFTMDKSRKSILRDIEQAFHDDRDEAYSISSGVSGKNSAYNHESLAVGNGSGNGVAIGSEKGSNYIYALFLDPEDPQKIHRYAYAMDWRERGNEITGQLVVTYATTLKFRQGKSKKATASVIDFQGATSDLNTLSENSSSLGMFNIYAQLFRKDPNSTAASMYASFIYNLCKKHPKDLSDPEKNLIATEIVKLKKLTKDEFIITMFDASIEALK